MCRYVSDGQIVIDAVHDGVRRINRPLVWLTAMVVGFSYGFGTSYRDNRVSLPNYRTEVLQIAAFWGLAFAIVLVLALLLGMQLGRGTTRRRMRGLFPVGSVTELVLDGDRLELRRPGGTRTIPLTSVRRVQSRRHRLHWLVVRRRPMVEVLPADLLPREVVDVIEARARAAVPLSWLTAPTGPTRRVVVAGGWAAHVARMRVGTSLVNARFWTARRAIADAMPAGSVATVEVLDDRVVSRVARWARETATTTSATSTSAGRSSSSPRRRLRHPSPFPTRLFPTT